MMNNKMENRKSEIIEIVLVTILTALGINLVSSSIFMLDDIKNIIIMLIGIIICISVIVYYLKIKVKSMNVNKAIEGNIIVDATNKKIHKLLEYSSSYHIGENINAVLLEDKEIMKKYNNSIENIEEYCEDTSKLQNSYFGYVINNTIEYEIIDIFTDSIFLRDKDIKTFDLNNAPKDILDNIFIKVLSKNYKEREEFNNYVEGAEVEGAELFNLKSDEGNIYNKFSIEIPKDATISKNRNSLVVESSICKLTIEWGIENAHMPFPNMEFYNLFSQKDKISCDDIEFSYFVEINVEYKLLSMFSKKANRYYSWIEYLVNEITKEFDFEDCLKRNSWDLLKNIKKII